MTGKDFTEEHVSHRFDVVVKQTAGEIALRGRVVSVDVEAVTLDVDRRAVGGIEQPPGTADQTFFMDQIASARRLD